MSYAAPTTYAAPQMSYMPQATMGGYPGYGAATASPYLDTATITQQEKDATAALDGQANMQQKMLTHQYETQKAMIEAECARNIEMAKNQFQQKQQQEMQLNMAKQQRSMAIQQQAASMQAQAQQYKLQMEMQQKMSTLYSGAGAGAGAAKGAGATKPAA